MNSPNNTGFFKVLIPAAGVGKRLGMQGKRAPKCLVEFDGKSLLKRHIEILERCGLSEITIAVGYQHELIETEIADIKSSIKITAIHNPDFRKGSILTLWLLLNSLEDTTNVLLMDADVLYDFRMIRRLLETKHENCFLLDRNSELGDEPVKLCISNNRIVEFRKKIGDMQFDLCGESVGFFRFSRHALNWLHTTCQGYLDQGRTGAPYEEVIREVLLANPNKFGFENITGLPWIEIDFPEDFDQARNNILPRLMEIN